MTYSVNIAQTHSFPRPRPQFPMPEINRQCILERISIEGFRSFRSLQDFELRNINVLIGANGSGKSNFIDFIEWIGDTARIALDEQDKSARKKGLWDNDEMLFFIGKEPAPQTVFRLTTAGINYSLTMPKGQLEGATFSLDNKTFHFSTHAGKENSGEDSREGNDADVSMAHDDGVGVSMAHDDGVGVSMAHDDGVGVSMAHDANPADAQEAYNFFRLLADLKVYHFHNIRETLSGNPTNPDLPDDKLARDGANIARFLRHLKLNHSFHYEKILYRVSMDSPFIEDFILDPIEGGHTNDIQLRWKQKHVNHVFHPCQLSDGTLRLVCLAAVLLQPEPPTAIVIDEPEMGLHPDAIYLLGETIRDASYKTQVIIATQSPLLVDRFELEDLVIASRQNGASQFTRYTREYMKDFLENYTLGELWQNNHLEGSTRYEQGCRAG